MEARFWEISASNHYEQ